MPSLSVEPWRLVVEGHAGQIAEALIEDLGPVRARSVTVSAGPTMLRVAIISGDTDLASTAWETVVRCSWLWADGGLLDGVPVGLDVTIGARTWSTSSDGMSAVSDGADRGQWAPDVGGRHLRAV